MAGDVQRRTADPFRERTESRTSAAGGQAASPALVATKISKTLFVFGRWRTRQRWGKVYFNLLMFSGDILR